MLSWVSRAEGLRPCGTCMWGWGWGGTACRWADLGPSGACCSLEPQQSALRGELLCPQGLLHPVGVPSCRVGGKAAAAPHEHGCCGAEGGVGSVSVEAVSGGF